jgi:hypothetical protein
MTLLALLPLVSITRRLADEYEYSRMDIAGFSFTHLVEFSKLALGFAIELADYKPEQ